MRCLRVRPIAEWVSAFRKRLNMNQRKQDLYVLFDLSCECGARLQVHGEHY